MALEFVNNKTEDLCITAVSGKSAAIKFIDNPSTAVLKIAAINDDDVIKHIKKSK